jgi:hypothetical protein
VTPILGSHGKTQALIVYIASAQTNFHARPSGEWGSIPLDGGIEGIEIFVGVCNSQSIVLTARQSTTVQTSRGLEIREMSSTPDLKQNI